MTKVVIFNLGPGNLLKGFPFLTAQLQEERNFRTWSLKGSLPPAPNILEVYKRWQLLYEFDTYIIATRHWRWVVFNFLQHRFIQF